MRGWFGLILADCLVVVRGEMAWSVELRWGARGSCDGYLSLTVHDESVLFWRVGSTTFVLGLTLRLLSRSDTFVG